MAQPAKQLHADLATAFRLAARFELHEAIDNHFSMMLDDGTFLINRWGVHWSRMTEADILHIDCAGKVLSGSGHVERTAFCIHAEIHRSHPAARAVLHTHMPFATALCCTTGRLEWISQNSLRFYDRVAYDDDYRGLAEDPKEGIRLAKCLGTHSILMMRNHGVVVTGPSLARAFADLYYLERAAKVQVLARASGCRPLRIPPARARAIAEQIAAVDDYQDHFDALRSLVAELA